jgi:hypothetical protein
MLHLKGGNQRAMIQRSFSSSLGTNDATITPDHAQCIAKSNNQDTDINIRRE